MESRPFSFQLGDSVSVFTEFPNSRFMIFAGNTREIPTLIDPHNNSFYSAK